MVARIRGLVDTALPLYIQCHLRTTVNTTVISKKRYKGPLLQEEVFTRAVEDGPTSPEFTKLVEWLTTQLATLTGLDDHVGAISDPADAESFLMELSGFLREYGCPYSCLNDGPVATRLANRSNRLHLLDYLATELEALRINAFNHPSGAHPPTASGKSADNAPSPADDLKAMLIALSFPKPPEGITAFQLFTKVEKKLNELLTQLPALSKPLLHAHLSESQWKNVEYINSALNQEYECRKAMVLKRLDVTIQSFKWSDKAKHKADQIANVYQSKRQLLSPHISIEIAHVLAAREDLLQIEKTSSGEGRVKCDINRVKIGQVPDRGGRVSELDQPPPEMPSFMKRQPGQPQSGGRGGRGGGGRGGSGRGHGGDRVQGGWGESKQQFRGDTGWSANSGGSQYQSNNPASAFFGGDTRQQSGHGGYDDGRPQSGGGRGGRRGGRGGRW